MRSGSVLGGTWDAKCRKAGTLSGHLLGATWVKNRKKGIQKTIPKSMPKKFRKSMPTGANNYAKNGRKIHDV